MEPFVALGLALAQRGHRVQIGAPEGFASFVTGFGLEFAALPGDPAQLSQVVNAAGRNPAAQLRAMFRHALPLAIAMQDRVRQVSQGAEAIGHTFATTSMGHEMAVTLEVPEFSVQLLPVFVRAAEFPAALIPFDDLGRPLNRFSHWLMERGMWWANRLAYAYLRRQRRDWPPLHGWPFDGDPPVQLMLAVSPSLVPGFQPAGHISIPGYFFVPADAGYQPDTSLMAFLERGDRPVYIGFGSMMRPDMVDFFEALVTGVAEAGCRAVIQRGWGLGEMDSGRPDIHLMESAPHAWLFQQVAAVVHHGGAGTVAAGLRAGVPNVVIPFIGDQPFWARRVAGIGAGPPPLARNKLTAADLAQALRQALEDQEMRARAAAVGRQIRREDGVGQAANLVAALIQRSG